MNVRKILIMAVLLSWILAGLASAENDKLGVTFDLTYMSKWMTKGKEGYGQQGAFFETFDIDLWGTGFGTAVGHQSATASGYVDKQRFNYSLYYGNTVFDGEPYKTKYKFNWTYKNYYGRARNEGNTQEWKFAFSWPELLSKELEPYYIAHYEYPAGSNYNMTPHWTGWVHRFGLKINLDVDELPQPLCLSSEVAYTDGLRAADHEPTMIGHTLHLVSRRNSKSPITSPLFRQFTIRYRWMIRSASVM
ncbi:MAG: hypothetical protein ACYSWZ_19700 [Planctomycetota bacterium]|jgi:hypothetical protein